MRSVDFHRLLAVAAFGLSGVAMAGSGTAAVRYPPIFPERARMSPDDRRAAVLADLEDMLSGPANPTDIATKSYLSQVGGLCRRDVIGLSYKRVGKDAPSSGAVRSRGISYVYPQYHFLGDEDAHSMADWDKACARLSGSKVDWATGDVRDGTDFSADKAAYDAFVVIQYTARAVRAGEPDITFECVDPDRGMEGEDGKARPVPPCNTTFLAAAASIKAIGRCPDAGSDCYRFASGDYSFSIVTAYQQGKPATRIKMDVMNDIVIT